MTISEIVNNETKKGNETLSELGEFIPEYKDIRLGSKGMYTPRDMVRSLKIFNHYTSFGDLMNGSSKAQ